MHVMFLGIPWNPLTGSDLLETVGEVFFTFTWTGSLPDWSEQRDGEQILKE
jgi:hypothetical protein